MKEEMKNIHYLMRVHQKESIRIIYRRLEIYASTSVVSPQCTATSSMHPVIGATIAGHMALIMLGYGYHSMEYS